MGYKEISGDERCYRAKSIIKGDYGMRRAIILELHDEFLREVAKIADAMRSDLRSAMRRMSRQLRYRASSCVD